MKSLRYLLLALSLLCMVAAPSPSQITKIRARATVPPPPPPPPPPIGVSIIAAPTEIAAGGTLTATWAGIVSPDPNDWIGCYPIGAPDVGGTGGNTKGTLGAPSGSVVFTVPAAGTYEFRMFSAGSYTKLATSNTFTVTGQPPPPPPPPNPNSSLSNYGVLADESAAYNAWGWAYTAPTDYPTRAAGVPGITGPMDVHGNLEADDLWQNIVMWQRTDDQGFYDLAAGWANYYKNYYLADFQNDLNGFFGDHVFGWGLVEWANITGDTSYLAAANAIADSVQNQWYNFGGGVKSGFYGVRGPGRQLKLAVKLGRRQWADDIWHALRDGGRWNEFNSLGVNVGFWKEDCSAFPWATGCTGAISSFEFAVLNEGLSDYYELTQDSEVFRRLILMANFAKVHGVDTNVNHTGHWLLVDAFAAGNIFHSGLDASTPLDPFYTCTMINVLTRGYLLTGDSTYLDRAKFYWDRSSKAVAGDSYPFPNRAGNNVIGHFMNKNFLSGNIFYIGDGELTYVGLLFPAANGASLPPPPPPPPPTSTSLGVSSTSVQAGSNITVEWRNIGTPIGTSSGTNWMSFTINGNASPSYIAGFDTHCRPETDPNFQSGGGITNGSCVFTIPTSTAVRGDYEFRLFQGQTNPGFLLLATSQQFGVTAAPGVNPPSSPFNLNTSVVSFQRIDLTWSRSSTNEDNFRIERCVGMGCNNFVTVGTVGAGVLSFSNTSLSGDTTYNYRVVAHNGGGDSGYSNTASGTTPTAPATNDLWTLIPNSSLRSVLQGTSYIHVPGPDGNNDNYTNILNDWNSASLDTNRQLFVVPNNGGHNSWFYNDVWAFDIPAQVWRNLRPAFLPYINALDANDSDPFTPGNQTITVYADGSPATIHTYDGINYMPALDAIFAISGPVWSTTGSLGPPKRFSMTTHNWTYGTYQGIFPPNGTCSGVYPSNPNQIWFRSAGILRNYDVVTDTYISYGTVLDHMPNYATCHVLNEKLWVFMNGAVWRDTPGSGTEVLAITGDSLFGGGPAPGVAWEPTINSFVIWNGGRNYCLLNASTLNNVCHTAPGDDPGAPSQQGTYKKFSRLGPKTYYLMNNVDGVWKLTIN